MIPKKLLLLLMIPLVVGVGLMAQEEKRPNIVLIMADDMGYSDIGCYGSEIKTPSIDKLAANGVRFRNFYNGARCCPTRASLLTGLYAHQAGMGGMEPDRNVPGFRGGLNNTCVTLAEALKLNGYSTYMAGKWHVTNKTKPKSESDKATWPLQRGFDRYFGTIAGAGDYYMPPTITRDNENIEEEVKNTPNFYYTDAISDNTVGFIEEHVQKKDNPFFMYVAYTAPHWPLQAAEEDIEKYRKIYKKGWDKIRSKRYSKMLKEHVLTENCGLSERDPDVPAWDEIVYDNIPDNVKSAVPTLDKLQELMVEKMAIYAAMIETMDRGIGRIVKTLEEKGELDNTLILFLSDNGGCAEWGTFGAGWENYQKTGILGGEPGSWTSYGPAWAHVSNTPFRYYKLYTHEGGVSTPLIAHWPEHLEEGTWNDEICHIIDIMPTFIDAADGKYPEKYNGSTIKPMEGRSLLPVLNKEALPERSLYWEHIGNRAVREGKWKVVSQRLTDTWQLYDMDQDRVEEQDLSSEYPEIVKDLTEKWYKWADRANVFPYPEEWKDNFSQTVK